MKSKIHELEKIARFYPCFVDDKFALFTKDQLDIAITRGQKRQDLLPKQNCLSKLFSKFLS